MKNKIQKINTKDSQLALFESQLDLLLKGQENNSGKLPNYWRRTSTGFYWVSLTKRRASKVKRPTEAEIKWSSEGIKSNQARTKRKSGSERSSCQSEALAQARSNDS